MLTDECRLLSCRYCLDLRRLFDRVLIDYFSYQQQSFKFWSRDNSRHTDACKSYFIRFLEKVFVHNHMPFQPWERHSDFTADGASGISLLLMKCPQFIYSGRLHLIDVSRLRKNVLTNITAPCRPQNLRVQHRSLPLAVVLCFHDFYRSLHRRQILFCLSTLSFYIQIFSMLALLNPKYQFSMIWYYACG